MCISLKCALHIVSDTGQDGLLRLSDHDRLINVVKKRKHIVNLKTTSRCSRFNALLECKSNIYHNAH